MTEEIFIIWLKRSKTLNGVVELVIVIVGVEIMFNMVGSFALIAK